MRYLYPFLFFFFTDISHYSASFQKLPTHQLHDHSRSLESLSQQIDVSIFTPPIAPFNKYLELNQIRDQFFRAF